MQARVASETAVPGRIRQSVLHWLDLSSVIGQHSKVSLSLADTNNNLTVLTTLSRRLYALLRIQSKLGTETKNILLPEVCSPVVTNYQQVVTKLGLVVLVSTIVTRPFAQPWGKALRARSNISQLQLDSPGVG